MMSTIELSQLELLAQVDELVERLSRWAEPESPWEPMNRCRALIRRLLGRVEHLRVRLEAPLVVATFGGTGTGKSTLVNALVGKECTEMGRQRPTTTQPVLILHPQLDPEILGFPLDDFDVRQVDSPILRDIVIIDCPDPDTTETETPDSNLWLLHRLLPYCDVLLFTSTQQKYRSARVSEEMREAATGCRVCFVQTHADLDEDIRDDWRKQLAEHYEVPEMFFVDSVRELKAPHDARRPEGDFGRLLNLLMTELGASQRVQIRRSNLVDLIHAALRHCRTQLTAGRPEVEQLEAALEEQKQKLTAQMSKQLGHELLTSRNLWERRLIGAVTQTWGFSPFSSMLRLYNGLGNLVASMGLFRARNSAQMALIGALQGARWFRSRQQERDAQSQLDGILSVGLNDDVLRESQFVIAGYVNSARLDPELAERNSLDDLRNQAGRVEDQFLGDAGRKIDEIIEELANSNSRFFVRMWYEMLFGSYLLFVLFRVGKNFFYDTFSFRDFFVGSVSEHNFLHLDFYIPAGIFFVLWSAVLVMFFTKRLRGGLRRRVEQLALELSESRLSRGLFPQLEQTCRDMELRRSRLDAMAETTRDLRGQMATSTGLGMRITAPMNPAG
jgi:hypothetical protein